jgi:hypothetical protein
MNAFKCKPKFLTQESNIVRLEPVTAPDKVKIYLPDTMSGATTALEAAVNSWNAALPSGVQFEIVSAECSLGPACIHVVTIPGQTLCGNAYKLWNSSGLITEGQIQLRTDWNTYTSNGLKRTFAHELGHFLGLDNSDIPACGVDDAVMQDDFDCAPNTTTKLVSPTLNDTLPVGNSTYGGKPTAACGW